MKKIDTLRDLTQFFIAEKIETPRELKGALQDESFCERLRSVKGIGPKTQDYLSILAGSNEHVAVDAQVNAFVRESGAQASGYEAVRTLIVEAAHERGWKPGDLDAAIWQFQSGRDRRATTAADQ